MIYQKIRYFLKAAETGSFSKAANLMYVTPQALTKQIGLLEEELGGRLFERSPKGVTLTKLGSYALERFAKVDKELESAVEGVRLHAIEQRPKLIVGIFSGLPRESIVSPLITYLLAHHDRYEISLKMVDLEEGRQLLMAGKLDILLTNTHEEDDWKDYRLCSYSSYPAKVIVSLLHPWAVKDEITVEDMQQETFLKMHMAEKNYRVKTENSFYENVPCKERLEVDDFNTMLALLGQGNAFCIFPMAFVYMNHAKIKAFDYPGRTFMFRTALVFRKLEENADFTKIIEDIVDEFELEEIITE